MQAEATPTDLAKSAPILRQHNAITQARYDYSACQLDIFFYLLSCLRRDDGPDHEYKIYVKDMEELTERKWNYQQLREATADMGSRVFEVENEQVYQQLWTFQRVEYVKGEGCLLIQLATHIRPYLFNLRENFTSYELRSALKLTSKYAKRIYQLASQWKDKTATRTYSLEEFKLMMHLKDPQGKEAELFQQISHLKARVLDVAVRQVNEHTDLKIDYVLLKKGRAYEGVRFTIARQQFEQLPVPFERPNEEDRLAKAQQQLSSIGIVQPQLVTTILGDEKYLKLLFKFCYDLKTNKVKATKNPAGLFLKICGLR